MPCPNRSPWSAVSARTPLGSSASCSRATPPATPPTQGVVAVDAAVDDRHLHPASGGAAPRPLPGQRGGQGQGADRRQPVGVERLRPGGTGPPERPHVVDEDPDQLDGRPLLRRGQVGERVGDLRDRAVGRARAAGPPAQLETEGELVRDERQQAEVVAVRHRRAVEHLEDAEHAVGRLHRRREERPRHVPGRLGDVAGEAGVALHLVDGDRLPRRDRPARDAEAHRAAAGRRPPRTPPPRRPRRRGARRRRRAGPPSRRRRRTRAGRAPPPSSGARRWAAETAVPGMRPPGHRTVDARTLSPPGAGRGPLRRADDRQGARAGAGCA